MPPPRSKKAAATAATLLAGLLWLLAAATARAEHEHVVGMGQNLARIARRYHVSVAALAAANGLDRSSLLREGQVLRVPERGVIYVSAGDTLAAIARRHDVAVAELAKHNRIDPEAPLRIGQRLILPGFEAAAARARAERRWGRVRAPGVATLYRIWSDERQRVRLVDRRGRVRRPALRQLAQLLRPRNSRKHKQPHPRLVRLLAQVSDHFGGRPLHVVSGYRLPGGNTKRSSRHVQGHAIDLRIPGVPLQALHEYCRRFNHVGVGLYPESGFVHLDVRRTDARWTDWSGPGEPARRRKPDSDSEQAEQAEQDAPAAADDGQPPIDDQPDAVVGE